MTRIDLEKQEMRLLFPQFTFFSENGTIGWKGNLKGYQFRIIYPSGYPTVAPKVYESPHISTIHRLGDSLCLWRTEEWTPDWTAATVVAVLLRFVDEHANGLV